MGPCTTLHATRGARFPGAHIQQLSFPRTTAAVQRQRSRLIAQSTSHQRPLSLHELAKQALVQQSPGAVPPKPQVPADPDLVEQLDKLDPANAIRKRSRDFELINRPGQLLDMLEDLRHVDSLAVDCEGVHFGQEGGKLCLLQLAAWVRPRPASDNSANSAAHRSAAPASSASSGSEAASSGANSRAGSGAGAGPGPGSAAGSGPSNSSGGNGKQSKQGSREGGGLRRNKDGTYAVSVSNPGNTEDEQSFSAWLRGRGSSSSSSSGTTPAGVNRPAAPSGTAVSAAANHKGRPSSNSSTNGALSRNRDDSDTGSGSGNGSSSSTAANGNGGGSKVFRIWIVDISSLEWRAFQYRTKDGRSSLKGVLESPNVTKLFYDVRNDASQLRAEYGVRLQGVYDLQLAEVAYRQVRLITTSCVLPLDKTLAKYLPRTTQLEEDVAYGMYFSKYYHSGNRTQVWDERPLQEEMLHYAASDVRYLHQLADTLDKSLPPNIKDKVWKESSIRLSYQGPSGTARSAAPDIVKRSDILQLMASSQKKRDTW